MKTIKEKILKEITPVSNQLRFPTCVANAICDALEYINKDEINLSRMFLYWNANKGATGGANISSALDVSKNLGIPPESIWPYSDDDLDKKPTEESYKEASERKNGNFYLVLSRSDIIEAIDNENPVVIGIKCPDLFNRSSVLVKDRVFLNTDAVDESYRHAMIIVGYRIFENGNTHFRVRNSYGSYWMDEGYCWFESDYIINNVDSSWAVSPVAINESSLSKRNLETFLSVILFCIFNHYSMFNSWLNITLFSVFFIFVIWKRFFYRSSMLDTTNIIKLTVNYRNTKNSPALILRKPINSYLSK